MKKTIIFLSNVLVLIALTLSISVFASQEDIIHSGTWDNLTWTLNETTGELIIFGTGPMKNLSGPNTDAWCAHKSLIKTVVIERGVTSIGSWAFADCINLSKVTIPDSVKFIADSVFQNCSSLTSIIIPEGVISIGASAFYDCSRLESIALPTSMEKIESGVFQNCSSLVSITIPEGVEYISRSVFSDCINLESIVIPKSVKSIEDGAFFDCRKLKSITIPEGVTSIGIIAFCNCSSLEAITIPDSLTSLGDSAFKECNSLKTAKISGGVKSIDWTSFNDCDGIEKVYIDSESVVSELSFVTDSGCFINSTEEILIKKSITNIPSYIKTAYVYCQEVEHDGVDYISYVRNHKCVDANRDHKCDTCFGAMGVHKAANGTHICDYCDVKISECIDVNRDHKCDVCFASIGTHARATGKHTCDYCGATMTVCADADNDNKCDACGKIISGDNITTTITSSTEPDITDAPVTTEEPSKSSDGYVVKRAGLPISIVKTLLIVIGLIVIQIVCAVALAYIKRKPK